MSDTPKEWIGLDDCLEHARGWQWWWRRKRYCLGCLRDIAEEIGDALEAAKRTGAGRDVPEGARVVTISHTLATEWARRLRGAG